MLLSKLQAVTVTYQQFVK